MAYTNRIPAVSVPTETKFVDTRGVTHDLLAFPNPDDASKSAIQLGVRKIRAVLANLDAAKAFVAKYEKPKAKLSPDITSVLETLKASGATPEMLAAVVAKLVAA